MQIDSTTAVTFCAAGCDGSASALTANTGLTWFASWFNDTAAIKTAYLDFVGFKISGLTR
jgi:hypothetical protein